MQQLILNRYQPLYEAGSGGFAEVIVAYDTRINRNVAIKCIPLDEAQFQATAALPASISIMDTTIMDSFDNLVTPGLKEARTAAMLNDASIVQIYDFEIQNNTAYLIMEYVDGITVGDLMRAYRDFIDADVVAAIFKAVSHALEVAHKNNVLHLDIKPDNILINKKGQVKVTDFGLARLADEGSHTANAGGTIGYMPVEQMNREDLDERCDEWALASLTYELITGNNHFVVPTLEEAEDAIFDAELVLPSLCMDGIDESIDDILFCALSPYRDERYDSVKEFARELKPCLGNANAGVKKLAQLVSFACGEDIDEAEAEGETEDALPALPAADHDETDSIPYVEKHPFNICEPHTMKIWIRIWSVINTTILGAITCTNFPLFNGWTDPITWGVLAVLMAVSAVCPHVGALLSFIAFGAMLCMQSAPIAGAIVIAVSIAWWISVGHNSNRAAAIVLSPASFGAVGFTPVGSLLAGWLLRPVQAVVSVLCSGVLAIALGGFGALNIVGWDAAHYAQLRMWNVLYDNYLLLMQDPAQWCMLVSWVLAALVVSLLCWKGSRVLGAVGSLAGFAVLLGGCALGSYLERGGVNISLDPMYLIPVIIAGVATFILCCLSIPPAEEENEAAPKKRT